MSVTSEEPVALVLYQVDQERHIVPQKFIENFNPKKYIQQTSYASGDHWVFWSPVSTETPEELERTQGIVLHLDEQPEKKGNKSARSSALAGYYKANVLKIADSKADLETLVKDKRVSVPSRKLQESQGEPSKASKRKTEKRTDKKRDPSYISKDKLKKLKKGSDVLTRKVWSQNYDESSDDSDDYVITMKEANEKLHTKQREIDSLQRRLKRLEELEEMNLFWQRKYATEGSPDRPSSSLSVKRNLFQEDHTNVVASPKKSSWSVSSPVTKQKNQEESKSENDDIQLFEDQLMAEQLSPAKKSKETTPRKEEKQPTIEDKEPTPENEKPLLDTESNQSPPDEEDTDMEYQLTPRKKAFALAGLKKGVKGDSTYVKNLAMTIFGPELLMNSSYSGKIATGGKKKQTKETIPRPKLPASGLKVLTEAFVERLVKEDPSMTKEAKEERLLCLRDAIGDKIKYLRHKAGLS